MNLLRSATGNNKNIISKALQKKKLAKPILDHLARTQQLNIVWQRYINSEKSKQLSKNRKAAGPPKGSLRYPWHVFNPKIGQTVSVNIRGVSTNTWRLNYVRNGNAFPTIHAARSRNGKVINNGGILKNSYVGDKICKVRGSGSNCSSWTSRSKKHVSNFKASQLGGSKNWVVYKYGNSGIGIKSLIKLIQNINTVPTIDPKSQQRVTISKGKLRTQFLELKRNGDYGQVFTCKTINSDNNLYAVKPGTDEIASKLISDRSQAIADLVRMVKVDNFYFKKCCFWSNDGPSCFFALLLGVPFVFKVLETPKTYRYFPENWSTTGNNGQILVDSFRDASPPIQQIVSRWHRARGQLDNSWFLLMGVVDTAHDFAVPSEFQVKIMIRDLMKRLVDQGDAPLVDIIFTQIKSKIEPSMTDFIKLHAPFKPPRDPGGCNQLLARFDNDTRAQQTGNKMCLVFDAGTKPVGELATRTAMFACNYSDPSSS